MFGPIHNVVFDFDGTLVNTMSSIAQGMQKAILSTSGKTIPIPDLFKSFGPAPRGVLAKWVPEDVLDQALLEWSDFDRALDRSAFEIFPGVEELLSNLQELQIPFGLFTGRDRASTLRILKALEWSDRFFPETHIVCGDDGFKAKPSGEGLKHLLEKHAWKAPLTLMVGDHVHDMEAGREAQCPTAVALWDRSFATGLTERSRFSENWQAWDKVSSVDLRLATPDALTAWMKKSQN